MYSRLEHRAGRLVGQVVNLPTPALLVGQPTSDVLRTFYRYLKVQEVRGIKLTSRLNVDLPGLVSREGVGDEVGAGAGVGARSGAGARSRAEAGAGISPGRHLSLPELCSHHYGYSFRY